MMQLTRTAIPDVVILEPRRFADERGFFVESYNKLRVGIALDRKLDFVQDNHSHSTRNVLRGLHYQIKRTQAKLVSVTRGAVFDVAVDLRRSSPTFGQWVGVELSEDNGRQLWIPEGFAHGFLVLSELADFVYKTTDYYTPEHDCCLRWDDPTVGVSWPLPPGSVPLISNRDLAGLNLATTPHFS
jgi:dTDP-4-dehydrorhamnose 3,5-epimerase